MDDWPEPEIAYPCRWGYKVVGPSEEALRVAIAVIVGEREHAIAVSRTSRSGKYVSLSVEVLVHDHDERRALANALHSNDAVSFVL